MAPVIPPAKPGGRPRSVDIRRVVNGVCSPLRSGRAWRYLPREYGPWQTACWYCRHWRLDGTWARIHARSHAGHDPAPSAAILESQSVKTLMGGVRGFDGRKRLAGRKSDTPWASDSPGASDTSWWIRTGACSRWSCIRPTSPTGKGANSCSARSAARLPARNASGRTQVTRARSSPGVRTSTRARRAPGGGLPPGSVNCGATRRAWPRIWATSRAAVSSPYAGSSSGPAPGRAASGGCARIEQG